MKIKILLLLLAFPPLLIAEENNSSDPFALTKENANGVEEFGIVTQSEVDLLELKATELFNMKKYEEAIVVLDEFTKKSNYLANLISANTKPYYNASYDSKKSFSSKNTANLVIFENLSNIYKQRRNIAFAMKGECLLKLDRKEEALKVLVQALDLLGIKQEDWWKRTSDNLNSIIGISIAALPE